MLGASVWYSAAHVYMYCTYVRTYIHTYYRCYFTVYSWPYTIELVTHVPKTLTTMHKCQPCVPC